MRSALIVVLVIGTFCCGVVREALAADKTVGQFLSEDCAKGSVDCIGSVVAVAALDMAMGSTCEPAGSKTPAEDETKAVVDWLKDHPETHLLPRDDGIDTALKAVYPCR
jgi:hypothetical protein